MEFVESAASADIELLAPTDEMDRAEERIDALYQHLIELHAQVFELRVDIIPIEISTFEMKSPSTAQKP